jgi:hypothetical protein
MKKLVLTLAAALTLGGVALAAPQDPAPQTRPIPALRLAKVTVREAAARLTKESGVLVAPDSLLANNRIDFQTVGGSLETVLQQLMAQLPAGAKLKRTHLPSSAATSPNPNGDVLALIVEINETLAGPLNKDAKPDPDALIIQGRVVPADKAEMVLAALDMKQAFVLTSGKKKDPTQQFASMQSEGLKLWQSMTPEQRKAATNKQWDDFVNMDPNLRKAYMGQMMEQAQGIMQKVQQLPPDQVKDLFGGLLPPGGGGGRP